MNCKSCGGSLAANASFCGKCGTRVEVAESDGVRCPTCGTVNRAGAKFCSRDGTPLGGAVSTNEAGRPPSDRLTERADNGKSESVEAPGMVAARETPQSHATEEAPPMRPHRSQPNVISSVNGRSRLWLAVGVVVILAGAGGGYWFVTRPSTSSSVADVQHESAEPTVDNPQSGALDKGAVESPPTAAASETPSVEPSTVAQTPRVSVGDRWVAEVVDHQDAALNYRAERTVTDVGPDRIFTSVRTLGKDYVRVVEYTGEWALVATHLRSGATTSYAPVLPYLSFPLKPGKSWEARVLETDAEGNQRVHEVRARVESWETVRVPAGTFNALRVVLTDDISKDGVLVQQGEDVSWYAPEARRTVKTEETSFDPATGERRRRTISLVEYALKSAKSSGGLP
jgi:hypothetical protein